MRIYIDLVTEHEKEPSRSVALEVADDLDLERVMGELAKRAEHLSVAHNVRWAKIREGTVCTKCRGSGIYYYPNTATWDDDGFLAGQAFTHDLCDACWGSGDSSRPFRDLRTLQRALNQLRFRMKLIREWWGEFARSKSELTMTPEEFTVIDDAIKGAP